METLSEFQARNDRPEVGKLTYRQMLQAIDDWYYYSVTQTLPAQDVDLDAIRNHYMRMDPKTFHEPTANEIAFDALYKEYGCEIHKVLMPSLDKDTKKILTENEPLGKNRRTSSSGVVYTDFFGIPPESKGKTKRERSYWIGRVYNLNLKGRRVYGNLVNEVAFYFGVNRATVFRNARYAAAYDAMHDDTYTQADAVAAYESPDDRIFYYYVKGDMLKPLEIYARIIPWTTCDGFRSWGLWGRRGPTDRSYVARSHGLRKNKEVKNDN